MNSGNVRLFELIKKIVAERHPNWLPEAMPLHMPPWNDLIAK